MSPGKQRLFGVVLVVLSVTTVGSTVYYTNEQREISECQAEFNDQFINQISERNKIASSDRESLADLVRSVINSGSRAESRKALEKYLDTKDINDEERKKYPLPELPKKSARC
ncbi:hypothetical protein [Streptomyces sp. NPDC006477]|uniref:hypothetical protein n=1 Tax=Streptomyces sp. NPDC006477 TaxID=3364747 RepID=UPI00367E67D4